MVQKKKQDDGLTEKYRKNYPATDKQEVVNKTNNIRLIFCKELKRPRDREENGASAKEVELYCGTLEK